MEHDAFRYDFTPKELWFFLFGKPKCSRYGVHLDRIKSFETRPGSDFVSRQHPVITSRHTVKYFYYIYKCPARGCSWPLQELVKKKR